MPKKVKKQEIKVEPKVVKTKFNWKKIINNSDVLDSIIGFAIGVIFTLILSLFIKGIDLKELVTWVWPGLKIMLKLLGFAYFMKQAFKVAKSRKEKLVTKTWPEFWTGNLISISWIGGGFVFILGSEAILQLVNKILE